DDGIVSRLKFVRIGKDYQEYGLAILEVMLNEAIKQSETYQMLIKVVKKKVIISADDNIIPDPDFALELDIMQALKESKKTNKRQPGTKGSSKGTGIIPGVLDESTGSEQESEYSKEDQLDDQEKDDKEGDDDDEGDDHISDAKDTDDEDDETESDEDEIYKYKICVPKENAKKTEEPKDDSKKAELPPRSSNLSISSGFGDHFLKLSSDTSLVGTLKDTTDAEISSLLDVKIQSEVPHIRSPSVFNVTVSIIFEPIILTPVQETSSTAPVTTLPLPSVSTTPHAPQQTTTPIPPPPITTDALTITSAIPKSDAISVIQLRLQN
nr:hypothetical protein [Tanacetum cinerariifolium]